MTVASGQKIPVLPPKMEQVAGSHNSGGGGFLSPDKLVEMTDGFTSYTAATADADTTKGLQEAGTAFVELLLASAEENRANARPSAAFAESTEVGLDVLATNRNAANNDPYGYGYDETDGSGTSGSSKYDEVDERVDTSAPAPELLPTMITEDGEEIFDYEPDSYVFMGSDAEVGPPTTTTTSSVEDSDLNLVQELLVDEAAKFVDASMRSQLAPFGKILQRERDALANGSSQSPASTFSPPSLDQPRDAAATMLFGAPLEASRRLFTTLDAALPETLKPLAAPLSVPSRLAAAAAPLVASEAGDESVLATAEAIVTVLQKTVSPPPPQQDSSPSSPEARDKHATRDGRSEAPTSVLQTLPNLLSAESVRSAQSTTQQALELLTTDDEKVASLRAKVPGAASMLSRRFAANLVSRAVERLQGATTAELATGELREETFTIAARQSAVDAGRQVVSALSSSETRT